MPSKKRGRYKNGIYGLTGFLLQKFRAGIIKRLAQRRDVPARQRQTTVDSLNAGEIVIKDK